MQCIISDSKARELQAVSKLFIARQKIVNNSGKVFAYELLFRDSKTAIINFPSNIKATSQVLLSALTQMDLNTILGTSDLAFINANEDVIDSNILELLDPKRCVIEILEETEISSSILKKIASLKKKGYKIALDDFDCTQEMISKFQPLFKYLSIVKIDASTVLEENLKKLIPKFKQAGVRLLIEKIENSKDYVFYKELGFDLYQGYHIAKPEVLEIKPFKNAEQSIVLNLITLLKKDQETTKIETLIKQRPDLSYNIIRFINNQKNINENITSIIHALTLMGRDTLLRWLLVYLYAEVSDNEFSKPLLRRALSRAETMENSAESSLKEEAFMVGMFSMLSTLFNADIKDILNGIRLDKMICRAIIEHKGPLGDALSQAIEKEHNHFKEVYMNHFEKTEIADLLITLEKNNVEYE